MVGGVKALGDFELLASGDRSCLGDIGCIGLLLGEVDVGDLCTAGYL